MIVVVGLLAWRDAEPAGPAGRTCGIALAAAGAGSRVELVGRIGDDPAGDALLIALARGGVGHVAVLRDPSRPTPVVAPPADEPGASTALPAASSSSAGRPELEPADVALGLRYLTAFDVLVVNDDAPRAVVPECAAAASYVGARLVVLVRAAADLPDGLAADSTILEAPADEGDAFARLVGTYAAELDRGTEPAAAFAAATGGGWERPDG